MAYQPILGPIIGHPSELSTGANAVTLAGAGTSYVVLAVRLITPTPSGFFSIPLSAVSVLTGNKSSVEYRIVFNALVVGDPLVFTRLDSISVLEGAVGNGTQVITGGIAPGVGRFVPGDEERGLPRDTMVSPLAAPITSDLIAYLSVCPVGSGAPASVFARAEFDEIEVDENGEPLERGIQLGR